MQMYDIKKCISKQLSFVESHFHSSLGSNETFLFGAHTISQYSDYHCSKNEPKKLLL